MMSVFDDKDFEYGSTPESLELAKRFANRTTKQIATGDPQAFGKLSSADALSALENGTYRGLEGIDFGTAYGSPVARLPNGMVVDVTAGTMLSAIKTREAKRREIVAKMLRANDRDAYREKNRGSFDALLSGLVEEGGLSEAAAQLYRNEFDGNNPAAVLTTLLGFDRTDMRAIKAAEETARAARDQTHNDQVSRRLAQTTQNLTLQVEQGASAQDKARVLTLSAGLAFLGEAARGADWESNVSPDEMAESFGLKVVLSDTNLRESLVGLRKKIAEDSSYDYTTDPAFATFVGGLSKAAARITPFSPEYATAVGASLIGGDGSLLETGIQRLEQRTSNQITRSLDPLLDRAIPQGGFVDRNENDTTYDEREAAAYQYGRQALRIAGVQGASSMSDRQVVQKIRELANSNEAVSQEMLQVMTQFKTRFEINDFDSALRADHGAVILDGRVTFPGVGDRTVGGRRRPEPVIDPDAPRETVEIREPQGPMMD